MITLKHIEPSPTAAKIVPKILLPLYGWPHAEAAGKYPKTEMSFRSTTYATGYTIRGFSIILDRQRNQIRFVFDPTKADINNLAITSWLKTVKQRVGLGPLYPEPYWGLDDLRFEIGAKVKNCFYVVAEREIRDGHEYFRFAKLYVMSGFSFEAFLDCFEDGSAYVDFDARTGHNHGTKFRIRQDAWIKLYSSLQRELEL